MCADTGHSSSRQEVVMYVNSLALIESQNVFSSKINITFVFYYYYYFKRVIFAFYSTRYLRKDVK